MTKDNPLEEIDRMIANHAEYNAPYSAVDVDNLLSDIRKLIIADRERMINELNLWAFPDSDGIIYLSDAIAIVTGKEEGEDNKK